MIAVSDNRETEILTAHQNEMLQTGEPAGNSEILVVQVSETFVPFSPLSLPAERSFRMDKRDAQEMAIRLNRKALNEKKSQAWYVVVYLQKGGFAVLRVQVPSNWEPESEFDSAPGVFSAYTNMAGRRTVKQFNTYQIEQARLNGSRVTQWALHTKPLNSEELRIEDLDETEALIVQALEKNLGGYAGASRIFSRNGDHFYQGRDGVTRNISLREPGEVAKMLRQQAAQLLQAANELSGGAGNEITPLEPMFYEFQVNGDEFVHLSVGNVRNAKEAEKKAQNFLTLIVAQASQARQDESSAA